jgi:hypothetical protein
MPNPYADILFKRDDRRPFVDITLTDANGAVDLTSATCEKIVIKNIDNVVVSNTTTELTVTDTTGGIVRWQPAATGAVAEPANYYAEIQVTFNDGRHATFPNDDWFSVIILEDID